MITRIIRKQFFCVTDVRAIGKCNSQIINVCNWRVHRKYLMKAPELHKRIPARKALCNRFLCNWEINSQIIKLCV